MRDISNRADVIDSRNIIERIEHLQQLRQPGPVDLGPDDAGVDQDELFAELAALEALEQEAKGSPDWNYGETLIRDSYFTEYAQQLAEDIGAIKDDAGWPTRCIDWEQAAWELKTDYSAVDFDGVTYWIRS